MRTTLSLDEDVLEKARQLAGQLHLPLKTVVNRALRLGLNDFEKPAQQRPYSMVPRKMGLRKGYNLDNIQEVLAQAEGEGFR